MSTKVRVDYAGTHDVAQIALEKLSQEHHGTLVSKTTRQDISCAAMSARDGALQGHTASARGYAFAEQCN